MTTAWANVKTYQFEAHTDIKKSGVQSLTLSWDTQGQIDLAGKKLYQTLTGDISGTGAQAQIETYMVEGYQYQKPGVGTSWFKSRLIGDTFEKQDLAGRQVDLLTDATKVENAGAGEVNGISCQKLQITPDTQKLLAFAEIGQARPQPQSDATPTPVEVRNVNVTQCVALDTHLPLKNEVHFVEVSEGVTTQVDIVTTIQKINEAINIQLPAETANAIELPTPPSS
ncbi:MAG: hypothetical protein Q8P22_04515 [Chloroflexota bacterium]|nr:hypothetical protein [Chloroflexota bacterium]